MSSPSVTRTSISKSSSSTSAPSPSSSSASSSSLFTSLLSPFNSSPPAPSASIHPQPDYDILIKTLVVGDSASGKSSIIRRFIVGPGASSYPDDDYYVSTIGVDFESKSMDLNGKTVKLQLWDTAGQERFRTITKAFYRGADVVLLVFDLSDYESFNHVGTWIMEVEREVKQGTNVVIVGNKSDLSSKRAVTESEIQRLLERYEGRHTYKEVSAKKYRGIQELFVEVAAEYMKGDGNKQREDGSGVDKKVKEGKGVVELNSNNTNKEEGGSSNCLQCVIQ